MNTNLVRGIDEWVQLTMCIIWLIGFVNHSQLMMGVAGIFLVGQFTHTLFMRLRRKDLKDSAKRAIEQITAYEEDRSRYNLTVYPGDNTVQSVRALADIYKMTLQEANDLADFVPIWFSKRKISRAEAEYVKSKLEATGAKVRIEK